MLEKLNENIKTPDTVPSVSIFVTEEGHDKISTEMNQKSQTSTNIAKCQSMLDLKSNKPNLDSNDTNLNKFNQNLLNFNTNLNPVALNSSMLFLNQTNRRSNYRKCLSRLNLSIYDKNSDNNTESSINVESLPKNTNLKQKKYTLLASTTNLNLKKNL